MTIQYITPKKDCFWCEGRSLLFQFSQPTSYAGVAAGDNPVTTYTSYCWCVEEQIGKDTTKVILTTKHTTKPTLEEPDISFL
jgi:hypothetical protein